jgi:pimeloyl-ACP methyl ester carboxylesterase
MLRARIVAAALCVTSCSTASTASLQGSAIPLAACNVNGVQAPALCGSHQVWENPDSKTGRRIPLHVVVIPARHPDRRQPDPVFYFDGGPGSSAIGAAGWVSRLLRTVNETRDLVFVDVRGTGRSAALDCPLPSDDEPLQAYFEEFLSDRYVRDCLARQSADVRFYTQPIAMDDVDEVRAALGYQRINLFGTSGGTRQAQLYMRRHGGSVRAVVMQGAAPMDGEMPLAFARAMEAGLRALFDGCSRDAACRAAHPALEQAWQRATQRFDGGAVRARVRHPRTGREEEVTISRGVFADGVRHLLYDLQRGRRLAGHGPASRREAREHLVAHREVVHRGRDGNRRLLHVVLDNPLVGVEVGVPGVAVVFDGVLAERRCPAGPRR